MVELISSNPARRFGLHPDKGSLTVGTDADVVVLDPNKSKTIKADNLHMNTDFNPYSGKTTYGWPRFVFSRGKPILEDDQFIGSRGDGEWASRRLKD
jgi:dihydropyrimidinase